MTCSTSDGSPPINFVWTKDGAQVEQGPEGGSVSSVDIVVRRLDDFSSSLVVESVQEQHTGNYTCSAENAAGRDSGTTSLEVLCK